MSDIMKIPEYESYIIDDSYSWGIPDSTFDVYLIFKTWDAGVRRKKQSQLQEGEPQDLQ